MSRVFKRVPFVLILLCVVAVAVSCGKSATTPSAPSPTGITGTEAGADGSTLKVTAPTPESPINGAQPSDPTLTLVAGNATSTFAGTVSLTYRFEIYDSTGRRVYQSRAVSVPKDGKPTHQPDVSLEADRPYQWRVRAEYLGAAGPWSVRASFVAPENNGYVRGAEIYDPLIDGKTVGEPTGDLKFIPGLGVQFGSQLARIRYQIPTLTGGEFSILVTNLLANTEGGKTKIFCMAQGSSDITTNQRRFTIEKRGNPPGMIAWRLISSSDRIETFGEAQRPRYNFLASKTYFWKATWGGGRFNLLIREGGVNGHQIYSLGKPYNGVYNPNPHYVWIGGPPGRGGTSTGSVDRMIVRQVWVSARPRPEFANK